MSIRRSKPDSSSDSSESRRPSFQVSELEGIDISTESEILSQSSHMLWKKKFIRKVHRRVNYLQAKKKYIARLYKEEKANIEKRIPIDLLTSDWFNENKLTVHTRLYALENLLPALIVSLERLLIEVRQNNLTVVEKPHPYFNPINFLARHLMRNNPHHCNFPETSSYMRGLKQVLEDLRDQVVDIKDNRLAKLKIETKEKNKMRIQAEKKLLQNEIRLKQFLLAKYEECIQSTSGNLQLSVVQNILTFFSDHPTDSFQGIEFAKKMEETDTTTKTVDAQGFTEYLYGYINNQPPAVFDAFLSHISECATILYNTAKENVLRYRFTELFSACDSGKGGSLKRKRLLYLFQNLYDASSSKVNNQLRNPHEWPVLELDEVSDIVFVPDLQRKKVVIQPKSIVEVEEMAAAPIVAQVVDQGEAKQTVLNTDQPADEQKQTVDQKESDLKKRGTASDGRIAETTQEMIVSSKPSTDIEADNKPEGSPPTPEMISFPENLAFQTETFTHGVKEWTSGTKFSELKPLMHAIQEQDSSDATFAFDKAVVNVGQFVQMMMTFAGTVSSNQTLNHLVNYIRKHYRETTEEKLERFTQAKSNALSNKHKIILDSLFQKLDLDESGFIDMPDLATTLTKYKDGMEKNALRKAHIRLKMNQKCRSGETLLTKQEFRSYIEAIVTEIADDEEAFDSIVQFLSTSTSQSCYNEARASARRKWLFSIKEAARIGGASMGPVYKAVFECLYKDVEGHGDDKKISASIAFLKHNYHKPSKGETFLHYVACTVEDANLILNQGLYRNDQAISFHAVDEGKPIYIPRIQDHGGVHSWNCKQEKVEGAFIAIPIKDLNKRVFGVLGIDTVRDPCKDKIFMNHEINFYQGVTKAFSIAYHYVQIQRSILQVLETALSWIYQRSTTIKSLNLYFVDCINPKEFILQKRMTADNVKGTIEVHTPPIILKRKDNLFREYLFKCAAYSVMIITTIKEEQLIVVPLRKLDSKAFAVIVISLGREQEMTELECRNMFKMLEILQRTTLEILKEIDDPKSTVLVLEAEEKHLQKRIKIMFERCMLMDLRKNIQQLDPELIEKIKGYSRPPSAIQKIITAVMLLLDPKWKVKYTWEKCKQKMDDEFIERILKFDPTSSSVSIDRFIVGDQMQKVTYLDAWKEGSVLAHYLYNWVSVCVTLMAKKDKLKDIYKPPSICQLPPIKNGKY